MIDAELLKFGAWAIGIVGIYALLARGLFRSTEPLRYLLIEISEEVKNSGSAPKELIAKLDRRLSDVHSITTAWKFVFYMVQLVFLIPFRFFGQKIDDPALKIPVEIRAQYRRFLVYWFLAVLGNSPAATFIVGLLILLIVAFTMSVAAISSLLDRCIDHDGSGGVLKPKGG